MCVWREGVCRSLCLFFCWLGVILAEEVNSVDLGSSSFFHARAVVGDGFIGR